MSTDRTCTATFDAPAVQQTLDIIVAGGGTGTVTSNPGSINCPGTCSDTFVNGTVVALTPTPTGGSTFAGWSGTGCSNNVTMSTDRTCTATFDLTPPTTHTLTITQPFSGTGSGTVTATGINCPGDCTEDIAENTVVALTANPAAGSTFISWGGSADCGDGSVTMTADVTCSATFDLDTFTLAVTIDVGGTGTGTVTSDVGSISCPGTCSDDYSFNTVVTLTPAPDMGSSFAAWSGDADCSDGVVTMSAAVACTATFDSP